MPRSTRLITQSGPIDLNFAGDVQIANVSGRSDIYVIPADELEQVDDIADLPLRNGIFNAMYRIKAGDRKPLTKGIYNIILGADAKAFISYAGTVQKVKQPSEPVTPV